METLWKTKNSPPPLSKKECENEINVVIIYYRITMKYNLWMYYLCKLIHCKSEKIDTIASQRWKLTFSPLCSYRNKIITKYLASQVKCKTSLKHCNFIEV